MNFHRCLGAAALVVALGCSHAQPSPARVALVQPSGSEVPANLLRFSIRFEAQVEGPMLRRLALLRADGMQIQEPFLEQELWSPDGKLLTVLMHPGRVKSGLIAHDERGPILSQGQDVTLALDGHPIKQWRVGPRNAVGPAVTAWKISAVRVGSKQSVVVTLDEPIDGRAADYLAIADQRDRRVAGHAQLADGESTWTFVPNSPWRAGAYKLVVRGTLEDPAGNRVGSNFETPSHSPSRPTVDAVIPFVVGGARLISGSDVRLPGTDTKLLKNSALNFHDKFPRGMCRARAEPINPDLLSFTAY